MVPDEEGGEDAFSGFDEFEEELGLEEEIECAAPGGKGNAVLT